MHCPRCQHDNAAGQKFCGECGARLASGCPSCGASNPPTQKFCGECGTALAQTDGPAKFGTPQSYTPKHLVEKIISSKAALEGERKQVTVLFADLKGSMELLADRDPEDARKILDPVLERMMEAVHRYEGTVNQVMGDGIMALFGAPLAHEDHAVRACYAALRMQESVARYAEEVFRAQGVRIKIRVGLNSGEVVVRAIGSDLHMDYTAVGQTTHLAARMEQLASPGSILLTPSTLALVEGFVVVKPLGPVPVKGLANPVEVYEATGAGPARTRLQATARRGLTRFVGRDAELEQFYRAQQLAGDGHGQVVAVVGEAGVGKSRFIHESIHSPRLQDWLIVRATAVSYGKTTSYLPVIDLLKDYFKIQDRDDFDEIREKVTAKLLMLDRSLEPTLPALLALLDVPVDDDTWQALDPAERRRRTLDAVKGLLLREAREKPLLVIFEDLHWIDSETQALLDRLVGGLGSARLLLLVNYRPEYQHGWANKTYYGQVRLDALPIKRTGELLDSLLGSDSTLGPLKQLLVKRGNPFFVEETIRTLVETKALAGDRGSYQLTQPVREIRIPDTVQVVLAARIDRLLSEDKRLLQVAAVVGKDVPFSLLREIADLPEPAIQAGLDRLLEAEFLDEVGSSPGLEYSFKHAVTHEVAYRTLLQDRRLDLHAQLVSAIERLHAHRLDEHVERLAYHSFRGAKWASAAHYLHEAGKRSLYRAAYGAASSLLEQTLVALQHLDDKEYSAVTAIDVRLVLQRALFAQGEVEQALLHLQAAEAPARALSYRLSHVLAALAFTLLSHGDLERALPVAFEALSRARGPGDRARAALRVGQVHYALGEYQLALEAFHQSSGIADTVPETERSLSGSDISVLAHSSFAMASADLGLFEEGQRRADEAIELAQQAEAPLNTQAPLRTDSSWNTAIALTYAGYFYLRLGNFAAALQILEPAFSLSHNLDMVALGAPSGGELATTYAMSGRFDDANRVLKLSRVMALSVKFGGWHPLWLACLAEGFAAAGQPEDATELATKALTLASDQGAQGYQAYALRTLGDAATNAAETATYYRRSLKLAETLGMRPLVAHCHLGLAGLYQRAGDFGQVAEHVTIANTMYREMGMTYWLDQAARKIKDRQ